MKSKRILSLLLSVAMLGSLLAPISAFAAVKGYWVKYAETYYAYGADYVSKQNEYYVNDCQYLGKSKKGVVKFLASGGYVGPGDHWTADKYHTCSSPKDVYYEGEKASLIESSYTEHSNGPTAGNSRVAVCFYKKEYADSGDSDGYFFNTFTGFSRKEETSMAWVSNETAKVYTYMPNAEDVKNNGKYMAIVFCADSAYDSMSGSKKNDYGGNMFYEWRYKWVKKPSKRAILKATPGVKKVSLKWKRNKFATGYHIQVSTSSKFSKKATRNYYVKKNKITSKTIKKLKSGKKYYIRLRCYKSVNGNKVYSSWSKKKVVKVK